MAPSVSLARSHTHVRAHTHNISHARARTHTRPPARKRYPCTRMSTPLNNGDRIGDWVVTEPLGAGGMGSVYRAHNSLTKQVQAAVKVLTHTRDSAKFLLLGLHVRE